MITKVTFNKEVASAWHEVKIEFDGSPRVLKWKTNMLKYPTINLTDEDRNRGYIERRLFWLGELPEIEVVS